MPEHKGWYSRNHLPHLDSPDVVQAITFRLADSVPHVVAERLAAERDATIRSKAIERALDGGHGSCWLRDMRVGRIVEDCLLWGDGERYRLLAWVVMPNHVHVLIESFARYPLHGIVGGWKSVSARRANAVLRRGGVLWQADFFDRYIRDEAHYTNAVDYIEANPVKAGLVDRPERWPLGSARRRGG
jgi:putative transposase